MATIYYHLTFHTYLTTWAPFNKPDKLLFTIIIQSTLLRILKHMLSTSTYCVFSVIIIIVTELDKPNIILRRLVEYLRQFNSRQNVSIMRYIIIAYLRNVYFVHLRMHTLLRDIVKVPM